jgi:hypothetical protein
MDGQNGSRAMGRTPGCHCQDRSETTARRVVTEVWATIILEPQPARDRCSIAYVALAMHIQCRSRVRQTVGLGGW